MLRSPRTPATASLPRWSRPPGQGGSHPELSLCSPRPSWKLGAVQKHQVGRAASVKAPPGGLDPGDESMCVCVRVWPARGGCLLSTVHCTPNRAGGCSPLGLRGTHLELVLVRGRFPRATCPRRAQALLQVMHGDELAGCKGTATILWNPGGRFSPPLPERWPLGKPHRTPPHPSMLMPTSLSVSVRANQPDPQGEPGHLRIFLTVMGRL